MKHEYPQKDKRSLDINVYKGKDNILIVPYDYSVGGFQVASNRHIKLPKSVSPHELGDNIFSAIEGIKFSPFDIRNPKQRDQDFFELTGYKDIFAFERKHIHLSLVLTNNDDYYISSSFRKSIGNNQKIKELRLPSTTTSEEIGQSILDVFMAVEQFYDSKKSLPQIIRTEFETLSGAKISFEAPQDEIYTDEQDYHAAEIYQGYSYQKENADESVADMFFGISAELDCDISPENVKKSFEEQYGKAKNFKYEPVEHPIFEFRAEMSNAKIHHIIYLKLVDEFEVLSCELILKIKPAGKRLFTKITKDFEIMVISSKYDI